MDSFNNNNGDKNEIYEPEKVSDPYSSGSEADSRAYVDPYYDLHKQENNSGNNSDPHTELAIVSMIFGILSILLCCCSFWSLLFGIMGVVFGVVSKKKNFGGANMALAGIITGAIGASWGIAVVIFKFISRTSLLFSIYDMIKEIIEELA